MVFDNLKNAANYASLSPGFEKAFAYLRKHDLLQMDLGRHDIDGDDLYVMVQNPTLKPWNEGVWESHRKYADIQIVLEGEEILGVRPTEDSEIAQAYDETKDVQFYRVDLPGLAVPVSSGDFMIFFPGDVHRPCIRRETPNAQATSRRAVIKVRI